MALTKSLTAAQEERFVSAQLGKYFTFAHAAVANTGTNPSTIFSDKTLIGERGEDVFDAGLARLENVNPADGYVIGKLESALVLAAGDFIGAAKKMKVLLRPNGSKLSGTVAADTAALNRFAINGSFCDASYVTLVAATSAPVNPVDVTPVGLVFKSGVNSGGGKVSPLGFFVQYASGFTFGQGDASGGDGMGGLTPVIMKQANGKIWKYGEKNAYDAQLPSNADAPETGDPGSYSNHLLIRSSKQYADQNAPSLGKTVLGYNPTKDVVVVMVQPNSPPDGGKALDYYRDVMYNAGCHWAVGMDGSDSVLMYEYKSKKLHVSPGPRKNNYLEVAAVISS